MVTKESTKMAAKVTANMVIKETIMVTKLVAIMETKGTANTEMELKVE